MNDTLLRFMDRLELAPGLSPLPGPAPYLQRRPEVRGRADSLNANYSFKYFGKGKGVSIYSFIDKRHLLFYSTVISAAEREAPTSSTA